jgi:hypothetical protein
LFLTFVFEHYRKGHPASTSLPEELLEGPRAVCTRELGANSVLYQLDEYVLAQIVRLAFELE